MDLANKPLPIRIMYLLSTIHHIEDAKRDSYVAVHATHHPRRQASSMSSTEEVVGRVCANCGSSDGKLRRCCGAIFYCDVACQKKHRKVHKLMCQNTSSSNKKKRNASDKTKAATDLFHVGVSKALAVDDGYDSFRDEESEIDLVSYEPPPRMTVHCACVRCLQIIERLNT